MWTELIITTKNSLAQNIGSTFETVSGKSADVKRCIDKTTFKGNYDFEQRIVYAFNSNDKVFLIFNDDIFTLRIHIESAKSKDKFDLLEKALKDTFNTMLSYVRKNNLKLKSATASVYAESSFLIKGSYTTRSGTFAELLKKDVPLKVY